MKKVLIIGNTCVDVIINLDHLPTTAEDLQPTSQSFSLGGCPFNVANIIRQSGVPFLFITPVGTGMYGDYVRAKLIEKGFPIHIESSLENGCCYCLVEANGERTFLSYHGVEYTFQKAWLSGFNLSEIDMIYICGLEVEEITGDALVSFLEEHPAPQLFFAPGPRLLKIAPDKLHRLFQLHPILHINEQEAFELSKASTLKEAAFIIRDLTDNTVIITLGDKGACYLEKDAAALYYEKAIPTQVVDTIGAGDSHIGQILASRAMEKSWEDALFDASKVSSFVVSVKGASLSDEQYHSLF